MQLIWFLTHFRSNILMMHDSGPVLSLAPAALVYILLVALTPIIISPMLASAGPTPYPTVYSGASLLGCYLDNGVRPLPIRATEYEAGMLSSYQCLLYVSYFF